MLEYRTGLVGEVDDMACRIYVGDFPRITVFAFLDEYGNQIESDAELQIEANKIAAQLNTPTKLLKTCRKLLSLIENADANLYGGDVVTDALDVVRGAENK